MRLFEAKQRRQEISVKIEDILQKAGKESRALTDYDQKEMVSLRADGNDLDDFIRSVEAQNTLPRANARGFFDRVNTSTEADAPMLIETPHAAITGTRGEHPRATEFRGQFAAWMDNTLRLIGGGAPQMEAAAPTGPISIGSTSGWDSIGMTVPTEILPYLPAYFNLDSFGLAGCTQIFTDHTRPLVKPIISAGAADSVFLENAAPSTSQPFGISGFTFGGTKYARLVLASYESLMNSELPLQGVILDELLASIATTLTQAITTSFVAALVAAASTLAVGVGGSGGSIYTSMIDLRHAIPPRFDLPSNKWMLSRATLAAIRNTRASTSGVPMFSPDGTKLLDREYVINDYLDTTTGAARVW
jgi:HK97 family phage major capsid protein